MSILRGEGRYARGTARQLAVKGQVARGAIGIGTAIIRRQPR